MQCIGVLLPPANVTCEREFPAAVPAGYSVHFTRLVRPEAHLSAASLVKMKDSAQEAAERLCPIEPAAIAYACTSGSFLSGPDAHAEIAERIRERTSIPAVTTASAVLAAVRLFGAHNVGVVTPYPMDITASTTAFLEAHGIRVAAVDTYNYRASRDIPRITPDSVAQRVTALHEAHPDIDAVFVSCTNVATFPVIESLEKRLAVPVITSNSATLWAVMRLAGYSQPLFGLGKLGSQPLCELGSAAQAV